MSPDFENNQVNYRGYSFLITQSSITQLDEVNCYGTANEYSEPEKGYASVVCHYSDNSSSNSESTTEQQKAAEPRKISESVDMLLYQSKKAPREVEIKCECGGLSVGNLTLDDGGAILVNLDADKGVFEIGRKSFNFDVDSQGHFSGLLRISIDERGEVKDVLRR